MRAGAQPLTRAPGRLDHRGLIAAFAAAAAWAFSGIFVRVLSSLSVWEITGWRLVIAFVGMLPVLLVAGVRSQLARALAAGLSWVLAGLMFAYYLTGVAAFSKAPVADVVLLINTTPLFVIAVNAVRGTAASRGELTGALTAFAGVVIIVLPNLEFHGTTAAQTLVGDAFAVLAALLRASYAMLYRAAEQRHQAPDVSAVSLMTFASGIVVVAIGASGFPSAGADWVNLLLLGLACTALPTWANAYAARRLPPIVTTTVGLLTPVVAACLAAAILGELPTVWVIVGGILVLIGLAILTRDGSKKAAAA
jgi:drug/metabolite transporter, DME family